MAAKALIRSEISVMVPPFVNPMFHNMGFKYAGLLLGASYIGDCASVCVLYLVWREGPSALKEGVQESEDS